MNRFARTFAALGLAVAASAALAAEPPKLSSAVMMTDAQMDNVTGGGAVDALIINALGGLGAQIDNAVQSNLLANVNTAVAAITAAFVSQGIMPAPTGNP